MKNRKGKVKMAKETKNETVQEEVKNEVVATEQNTIVAMENPFGGLDLSAYGFSDSDLAELTGLDKINASEISIPYATLISKASKDHEIGDIVFADGSVMKGAKGETRPGISVLTIQPVRVYFPTPFNPNNDYICRSIDGKKGHADGEYAGQVCETCEFAKYPEAGGSSPCRDQRLLLCTNEDGGLFHLQIGGIGMKVWKTFLSAQAMNRLPKCKGLMGGLKLELGVKTIDTPFGPFPAASFNIDPKDAYVSPERFMGNLNSLKSYKNFEKEHLESAAMQTKVQMAVDGEEGSGQNKNLF